MNTVKNYLLVTLGSALLCFSTTYFILPAYIYNGGVLGTAQVIQSILEDILLLEIPIDIEIAGVLNFF